MPEKPEPSDTQRQLHTLRVDYQHGELIESNVAADPIAQFAAWFEQAKHAGIREPNAMTLATADASGIPSARIVLLKDFDARGFTFYTNYASRKGQDLSQNPRASLCFFWDILERQVRIGGTVQRVSRAESKAYFDLRPRSARVGAWASAQSRVIGSREELEQAYRDLDAQLGENVPLPDHWGGYRVCPATIEFWQGRPSRLHDRLRYVSEANRWRIERLSP
jgi:pyridoxamine 5'-phosphate oxidase